MPDLSDGEFARVMDAALADAQRREENAGFGGESHDGGARHIRFGVECFRAGMNRTIPPEWLGYVRQMRRVDDPEYAEYKRLKEKFE